MSGKRVGGERRGDETTSDHFDVPSAVYHGVFEQVVSESGASGCEAW